MKNSFLNVLFNFPGPGIAGPGRPWTQGCPWSRHPCRVRQSAMVARTTPCPKFPSRTLVEFGTSVREALITGFHISLISYFAVIEWLHALNHLGFLMLDLEPSISWFYLSNNSYIMSLLDVGPLMRPNLFIEVIVRLWASYGA